MRDAEVEKILKKDTEHKTGLLSLIKWEGLCYPHTTVHCSRCVTYKLCQDAREEAYKESNDVFIKTRYKSALDKYLALFGKDPELLEVLI